MANEDSDFLTSGVDVLDINAQEIDALLKQFDKIATQHRQLIAQSLFKLLERSSAQGKKQNQNQLSALNGLFANCLKSNTDVLRQTSATNSGFTTFDNLAPRFSQGQALSELASAIARATRRNS